MNKIDFNLMKRYFCLFTNRKTFIAIVLFSIVFYSAADAVFIWSVQPFLDDGHVVNSSLSALPKADLSSSFIKYMPLLVILLFILRGISGFCHFYFSSRLTIFTLSNLRQKLFAKYLKVPVSNINLQAANKFLPFLIVESQAMVRLFEHLLAVFKCVCAIIAYFCVMFFCSWQLSLCVLCLFPLLLVSIVKISYKFRLITNSINDLVIDFTGYVNSEAINHQSVLACNGQQQETVKFNKHLNKMQVKAKSIAFYNALIKPIIMLIAACAVAFVLFFYKQLALSTGSFVAFFGALLSLLQPLRSISEVNCELQASYASMKRVFDLLDQSYAVPEGNYVPSQPIKGEIAFNNVCFSYNANQSLFNDVSFAINAKSVAVFLGRSGSGKSSIANLIIRLFDPESGTITVDGVDNVEYSKHFLRKNISYIPQNITLFNDTVFNNIAYGLEEKVTIEQVRQAADAAYATEFIDQLDSGFDSIITNNGNCLSGGQKQRIAIARAVLRDSPVIIMDEPTSALDSKSAGYISDFIASIKGRKTCILISHSFAINKYADAIFTIKDGVVTPHSAANFVTEDVYD